MRIGFLGSRFPSVYLARISASKESLRELGDANIVIEERYPGKTSDRLPELAKQLVDLNVDVILATYDPSVRAATFVDKILKGVNPAELPVEAPTDFDLGINLRAAKQIGLTIPPNVLARANKVMR